MNTVLPLLWQLPRLALACLALLVAFAGAGCVNDDRTDLSTERSAVASAAVARAIDAVIVRSAESLVR